jgi:hypothetical protein
MSRPQGESNAKAQGRKEEKEEIRVFFAPLRLCAFAFSSFS